MGMCPLLGYKKYSTNGKKMQEENVVCPCKRGSIPGTILYRKYEIQE